MRNLKEALIKLDQVGVLDAVECVEWGRHWKSLAFSTCGAFKATCEASRATPKVWKYSTLARSEAIIGDDIAIRHSCRPDLACWGET